MNQGWVRKKLKDCFKLKSGDGLTAKNMIPGDYPVFGGNSQTGTHNTFNLSGDNIIIGRVGALCGNARHITENIWLTDNAFKIMDKKYEFDNNFLTYLLNYNNLRSFARQAAQPVISNSSLKDLELDFPTDVEEQKRIVAILDQAFADLEQVRAKTERNLKNARELFDSYLEQVFSQKGDGWGEYELTQVADLKSGTTVKKELEQEHGDVAYIKVSGMNLEGNEKEITTSNMFLNKSSIKSSNILPVGTIIFPKRGGAIATNKKRITAIPLCIDLNTMGVIPKQEIVLPHYIYFYFKTFDLLTISNGTTIPQINNYSFDGLKLTLPNLSAQKEYIEKMRNMETAVEELTQLYKTKLNALDDLKKSILQKAFSGELTHK